MDKGQPEEMVTDCKEHHILITEGVYMGVGFCTKEVRNNCWGVQMSDLEFYEIYEKTLMKSG